MNEVTKLVVHPPDGQRLMNSTCPSAGSFVVQLTVALDVVMFVTEIDETDGAVLSEAAVERETSQSLGGLAHPLI